jgi:hypothetical protein
VLRRPDEGERGAPMVRPDGVGDGVLGDPTPGTIEYRDKRRGPCYSALDERSVAPRTTALSAAAFYSRPSLSWWPKD